MINFASPQLEKVTRLRKALALERAGSYISVKIYDRYRIAKLLSEGLTIRAVAKEIGCSTWPVQLVKKAMKQNGFGG